MRALFVFGVVMVGLAACKKHEPAPGLAPGQLGSAATPSDAVLARFGEHGGSVYPEQLVARDDGGFVLLAEVHGKIRLGDLQVAQTEEYHEPRVIVALDASGHVRWARVLAQCTEGLRVAVHGTETAVVGGCWRALDAPKDDTPPPDHFEHVAIGVLDDKGAFVWSKLMGDAGAHAFARTAAFDADGTLVVGGCLYASADLGKGRIEVVKREQAGFVAAYAPDGSPRWVSSYPNGDVQAVVVGGDEVDIGGGFKRTLDIAGAKLTAPGGGRFVARLAKATGDARAAVTVGENGSLYLVLARAPSGTLYMSYDNDRDDADVLASIDTSNHPKELHRYRNGPAVTLGKRALAVDATGAVWLASEFEKELDFGSGAIKAQGQADGVVAKYSPDGALLALTTPLATVENEAVHGLALTKTGPVIAMQSVAGPANKPYSEWLVTETYGLTSLVRIAP